jgi:hypothetical protein
MKLKILFLGVLSTVLLFLPQPNSRAQNIDEMFLVSVSVTGNGSGIVYSSPPGIDCGDGFNECSATFPKGTPLTQRARPMRGPTEFTRWSTAIGSTMHCPGTRGECRMIVLENSIVQAQFMQE